MPVIFTKTADRRMRVAVSLSAILVLSVPTVLLAWARTPYATGQFSRIEQPIPFDHRVHVADAGIDCRYCHAGADRSPNAGVPATAVCMSCHGQVRSESPLLAPVLKSFFQNEPIRWNQVNHLPGFVYFDHSIHTAKGVGCVTCHGRVDQMAEVSQAVPLTMGWCLDCHRAPEEHLRPADKVTAMDWTPEGDPVGAAMARSVHVRHLTNCSVCHR